MAVQSVWWAQCLFSGGLPSYLLRLDFGETSLSHLRSAQSPRRGDLELVDCARPDMSFVKLVIPDGNTGLGAARFFVSVDSRASAFSNSSGGMSKGRWATEGRRAWADFELVPAIRRDVEAKLKPKAGVGGVIEP